MRRSLMSLRFSSSAALGLAGRWISAWLRLPATRIECRTTLGLAALVPWAWLAMLVAIVVRARVASGLWSSGSSSAAFGSFAPFRSMPEHGFGWVLMYAMPPVVLLVILFSQAGVTVLSRRDSRTPTLVMAASAAAVVALIALDPLGLMRL
jgi:hypothetical protein